MLTGLKTASLELPGRFVGRGEQCGLEKLDGTASHREPLETTKTILICEDEPALRELVRASLDGGYRFAEASDGFTTVVGLTAVVFGAMNVVGGFWVTNRMLGMFRSPVKKVKRRK